MFCFIRDRLMTAL